MLIAQRPELTVRQISAHLGVREWNIARELKLARRGQAGRLWGRKVRGAGHVGAGGQWEVAVADYLDWLGVPEADRGKAGKGAVAQLPTLFTFEEVAEWHRIAAAEVVEIVETRGLSYLKVGRRRYLSESQYAELAPLLAAPEAPASP